MQENLILLFVGATIGLFSSLIGTWYQHRLQMKTMKIQREYDEKENLRTELTKGVNDFVVRNWEGSSNLLNYASVTTENILCYLVIDSGPDKGVKFPVKKSIILIGNNSDVCDLILSDPKTGNIHFRLLFIDNIIVLEDFSGEALLNNKDFSSPVSLSNGDAINFGNTKIMVVK